MNSTSAIHNKIINYVSDKYYDNFFKTKGIPVSELEITNIKYDYKNDKHIYYVELKNDNFDDTTCYKYHDTITKVIVNSNGDIEDYKMFKNVINPKNNMEAWDRSLNRNYYDGVEW